MGRIIAIGDIHGCFDALNRLLTEIQPTPEDTIITLGDYVDRGPHSAQVIDVLIELVTRCQFRPLLGNHEILMAGAFNSRVDYEFWLQCGGHATLQSYGGDIRQIPAHHRTFLNHCQRFFQTDTHFFVHANYEPRMRLEEQPDEILFWQHIDDIVPEPHFSKKTAIVGHTPQEDGEIRDLGHLKIIDTFCYGDGWLTALDIETGQTWQARMDGMLRESNGKLPAGPNNETPPESQQAVVYSKKSPLEVSGATFKKMLEQAGKHVADFLDELPDAIVHPDEVPAEEFEHLREPLPDLPTDYKELLQRIFDNYVQDSFNTTSPGYLAYVPGGGVPEAAIADMISQVTNRFITVWMATPKLAQIEATVVNWFCELIGYKSGSGGYLSSGGSTANQTAIVAARTKFLEHDYTHATMYVSDQGHHCLRKSAFLAGIPRENYREIGVDNEFKIQVDQLRETIERDKADGFKPFLIIGNAGTTNTGAVDDLQALRDIADDFGIWFHADAAYGGFFCLTKRGHQLLDGIETADSVVLDPHKGMFMPYGTGCLLVKDARHLLDTHSFTSDYMPNMTGDPDRIDFCKVSPELSRGNRSLRLWLPIKHHGIGEFRELLDEKLDLINWIHQELVEYGEQIRDRLEIVTEPQLSILSFRLVNDNLPVESVNRMNRRLLDAINASGRIMLTGTMLDDKFVIRICVLSFRTHLDRMQECLDIIRECSQYTLNSTVS